MSLPSSASKLPEPTSVTKRRSSLSKPQPKGSTCSASPGVSGSRIFRTNAPSGEKMPQPCRAPFSWLVSSPNRKSPLPSGSRQTWPFTVLSSAAMSTDDAPASRSYTSSWLPWGAKRRSTASLPSPLQASASAARPTKATTADAPRLRGRCRCHTFAILLSLDAEGPDGGRRSRQLLRDVRRFAAAGADRAEAGADVEDAVHHGRLRRDDATQRVGEQQLAGVRVVGVHAEVDAAREDDARHGAGGAEERHHLLARPDNFARGRVQRPAGRLLDGRDLLADADGEDDPVPHHRRRALDAADRAAGHDVALPVRLDLARELVLAVAIQQVVGAVLAADADDVAVLTVDGGGQEIGRGAEGKVIVVD